MFSDYENAEDLFDQTETKTSFSHKNDDIDAWIAEKTTNIAQMFHNSIMDTSLVDSGDVDFDTRIFSE